MVHDSGDDRAVSRQRLIDIPELLIVAIEISAGAVHVERPIRGRVLCRAGERLPADDGCADVVYCVDVLEHVADLDAVIGETARVLKPGGRYLFDTINRTRSASSS